MMSYFSEEPMFYERVGHVNKDGDIQIDISAGIALATRGDNSENLIHKADIAMYEMKKKHKLNL
jgi:GGDEF domain-containing protein